MSLPRTGADKNLHAPSGNLQLLYMTRNQTGTHQWLCKLAMKTVFCILLSAKPGVSDQDLIFLPTKHLIPQQTSEVAISQSGKRNNQVSSVSKQYTKVTNSCFPSKEALASNAFRPLKLARDLWLASTQQPNPTLSLPIPN